MSNINIYFSKFLVSHQVFFKTNYSYAIVNLKPLVPGHVLVVPLRTSCINLCDLTREEHIDYFKTVQLVHQFIKLEYKAKSLNISIQDGPEAGQSVAHLHTHIIPRYATKNVGDKTYDDLDHWTFETRLADWERRRITYSDNRSKEKVAKPDMQRIIRSEEDMAFEACHLSASINKFLLNNPQLSI